jgi:fibronectin type 3 domain-containing protein
LLTTFLLLLVTHSAKLTWHKPVTGDVASYNVYRNTRGCSAAFSKIKSGVTTLNYTDTTVTALNKYAYEVTAVDTKGVEGSPSNCVVVTIP